MVLDNVGGNTEQWAVGLLKPWSGAKFVTLVSPFLMNTDSMALLAGAIRPGLTFHDKATQVSQQRHKTNSIIAMAVPDVYLPGIRNQGISSTRA